MEKPLYEKYADDFASSRPSYPSEIRAFLFDQFKIGNKSIIADIACGTGLFTQLLSDRPDIDLVVGIDRSEALLRAGMRFFGDFCFEPLCACAELAPLKDSSCDMVSVAQGFHWLHRPKTLNEIARILKPGGALGLIWYRRHDLTKPHEIFMEGLTNTYNPNYDPTFMELDYMEMLENHGNFRDVGQKNFFETKAFDLDTYIGWQKSKSFIGDAMEPEILGEFLKKVKSGIVRYFPNGIIRQDLEFELIYAERI